jgi:hypothetical protein
MQDFLFKIDHEGEKRIQMTAALTPRSGKIRFLLDSRGIRLPGEAEAINLYMPGRTLLRNFMLTAGLLTAGYHTLTLEYMGTESWNDSPEIGLDFFWIQDIRRTVGE